MYEHDNYIPRIARMRVKLDAVREGFEPSGLAWL
jgi:hypothetical protein